MAAHDRIVRAADELRRGGLVAFPTETVYGLGANAGSDDAIARLFEAKRRPRFNPLIVHVSDRRQAEALVLFDDRARALADRFWPGPLSLVLPRRQGAPVSHLAGAGLDSLAVRVPAHPVALALIEAARIPVAAPSANPSGGLSPTSAHHVVEGLGARVDFLLDGGPCRVGVESTVVDLTAARAALLRPGGIDLEALEKTLGPLAPASGADARPRAPGRLASHYAPSLPLRLAATGVGPDEALLSFGSHRLRGFAAERNLSPGGDLREAAANLFAALRALDRPDHAGIAAMPVPEIGLGRAIMDRLRRAAAARPLADPRREG